MKIKEFLSVWLSEQLGRIKAQTFKRYKEVVCNNIVPAIGELELDEFDAKRARRFIQDLSAGHSDNTVLQITGLLRRALDVAVSEKIIGANPTAGITLRHRQRLIEPFSEKEQRKIEDYVIRSQNPYYYGIILALYTGVRIGELLALTWDDVDLKNRTVTVSKTASAIKVSPEGNPFISTPKTAAGFRTVPFPRQLTPLLKKLKTTYKSEYVVCTREGGYMTIFGYQKAFSRILKRLGIKHRGFHSLRHTYATRALETGADIKTLSEMLGHSSPTVTITRYCHSTDKQKNRLCSKLGENLKRYAYYPNRHTFT